MPAPNYLLDVPVEEELWDIWDHTAKDNVEAADCVVKATHETLRLIAFNPGMGKRCKFQIPRLKDVYFRTVVGFDNYLVFYRKVPGAFTSSMSCTRPRR